MRIKITKGGIFGMSTSANPTGEIPVGTIIAVKSEPLAWAGRYEVIDAGDGEVEIVNPDLTAKIEARDTGSGWWTIFDAEGNEVGKKIRKEEAEAFNAFSDAEKAEYLQA